MHGLSQREIGMRPNILEKIWNSIHREDPQLKAMNLRAEIAQTSQNSPSFEKLIESIKNRTSTKMLQLSLLEKCDFLEQNQY